MEERLSKMILWNDNYEFGFGCLIWLWFCLLCCARNYNVIGFSFFNFFTQRLSIFQNTTSNHSFSFFLRIKLPAFNDLSIIITHFRRANERAQLFFRRVRVHRRRQISFFKLYSKDQRKIYLNSCQLSILNFSLAEKLRRIETICVVCWVESRNSIWI